MYSQKKYFALLFFLASTFLYSCQTNKKEADASENMTAMEVGKVEAESSITDVFSSGNGYFPLEGRVNARSFLY